MLKVGLWSFGLTVLVASVAAVGYGSANVGDRSAKALAAFKAEGCPFAAMRAAFAGGPASSESRTAGTEAAFHTAFDDTWVRAAARATGAAAQPNCPEGSCPWAAAQAGYLASIKPGDITRQVTPTADGVVIRISANKPALVKMIHAHFGPVPATASPAAPAKGSSEEVARK